MYFILKIKNGIVQIAVSPKKKKNCSNYLLLKSYTTMRCRFNCHIYYTIYIILTRFIKLNVWYSNETHSYEVDYRLLSHISSHIYMKFSWNCSCRDRTIKLFLCWTPVVGIPSLLHPPSCYE